jgi:hypothetical protein
MPRKRNTETDLIVSAGAAPARRKAATTRSRARTAETTDTPAAESATLESAAVIDAAAVIDSYEVADAPAREEIAALAYSYWESRGYQGGSPEDDWLRAETELRTHTAGAVA